MKTIYSWNDLEEYGIVMLTGEACGHAMRLLCDVTESGKALIERFLGGTVKIVVGSNWNGGFSKDRHVGSVLLPRSILPDLSAFILLATAEPGFAVVTMEDGTVRSLSADLYARYEPRGNIKRTWRRSTDPGTGDRNEHAMSGRIE